MATAAAQFFPSADADDQAFTGEATIRDVQETAPAANSATSVTWTTTTITEKTIIPVTANSAAGDSSSNNGWAFNNGGADGLGSVASARRTIAAGVWAFSMSVTLNTPALLDTHAATIKANIYRVATGGGTRTLLFSATSANFAASTTLTWNSASQPQIVLAAGEVIMEGYTATSASTTATLLGANTNTVLTLALGTNTHFTVPSPGIRTRYSDTRAAILVGIDAIVRKKRTTLTAILVGADSLTRRLTLFRSLSARMAGVALQAKIATLRRVLSARMAGVPARVTLRVGKSLVAVLRGVAARILVRVRKTLSARMAGIATFTRLLKKLLSARMAGVAQMLKRATLRRTLAAVMAGRARGQVRFSFEILDRLDGGGSTVFIRPIFVFDD